MSKEVPETSISDPSENDKKYQMASPGGFKWTPQKMSKNVKWAFGERERRQIGPPKNVQKMSKWHVVFFFSIVLLMGGGIQND